MFSFDIFSGLIGSLLIITVFFAFASIGFIIFLLAANWRMFKMANVSGWKSIIPFYNIWTMCKIVGLNPYWVIELIVVYLGSTFVSKVLGYDSILGGIMLIINFLNSLYFTIIYTTSISKSYNKDSTYAVLLIFFPFIGIPILGFGNTYYIGPHPANDPIMDYFTDAFSKN